MDTTSTGRRPIRSESWPQIGANTNCANEKPAISIVTRSGLAPKLST